MTAARNLIPSDALARASLDRLDATAAAMERKWGMDRLPKLVEAALSVRFRSQADRLDEAIRSDGHEAVSVQAEAMLRAWGALDKAAMSAGWSPLAPTVWEVVLPETGEIVAIVRDADEAALIVRDRGGSVWTLAEIAIAIEAFGETVRAAKRAVPGAEITAVRPATKPGGLAIGSAAVVGATERETKPAHVQPAHRPRRRSAGFSAANGPLLDHRPEASSQTSSSLPPAFWEQGGDDIPF